MEALQPNLTRRGRFLRAVAAIFTAAAAIAAWPFSHPAAIALSAAAAFLAFEAARGWCALRACGIKTRF